MPKKQELSDVEAIDILKNEIADYVIGDYCATNLCPIREKCLKENRECIYNQSIDRIIKLINRKNIRIDELRRKIDGNSNTNSNSNFYNSSSNFTSNNR